MSNSAAEVPATPGAFAPTRWTLVLRASADSGEGRTALSELCAAYYSPVFRFLQRSGHGEDAAQEIAQEFFARVLARGGFAGPDPARGRFRNYLLGAVKYFLRDQHDLTMREKRGGGAVHESLDHVGEDSPALQIADPAATLDDASFDREWAVALMNRAVAALEAEHGGERAAQFAALRPWLMGEGAAAHAETAAQLGMNEGAVKVAVHRLRRRFRELLKAEVAQTIENPADLEDELRHLCAALAESV
jgi:DNA-directed RNA polymerase specialized sigma24 family protein